MSQSVRGALCIFARRAEGPQCALRPVSHGSLLGVGNWARQSPLGVITVFRTNYRFWRFFWSAAIFWFSWNRSIDV